MPYRTSEELKVDDSEHSSGPGSSDAPAGTAAGTPSTRHVGLNRRKGAGSNKKC